jgi:autotransporter-associated beta strand protein
MSIAIANQMFLAYLGRPGDATWRASTATVLNGAPPSVALQNAMYSAAVLDGVFSLTDSSSQLVNKIFLNLGLNNGAGATSFEQNAWAQYINNGTLTVAPTGAIQTSPGISILASGTLDVTQKVGGYVVPGGQSLAGAGLVSGSVTMSSGATLSPGSNLGTLTISNDLTLNGGGNYNWQIVSGSGSEGLSWDLASVGGTLSIASTSATPFKINLWSLSGTSPDVNGNAANFNSAQNYTWTIATAAGGISGFSADKFRINTSATNGTTGFSNPFGSGTFSVAQSGNNLNLVFTAGTPSVITINVASGTQTQSQAGYPLLSGSTPVQKTGAGTVVINAANTVTGSTTVQQGTLQLANAAALASSRLTPLAGGTVTLAPYLQTAVAGLNPNAGGLVDVGNGMIVVASGLSVPDMLTAITAGYNGGTWTGTTGITSSNAAVDTAGGAPRAIGWLDNGDGSVTFAFAAPGDTNLDGLIDVLDAAALSSAARFNDTAVWSEGDFNYDGIYDDLDNALFVSTGLFDAGPYNAPPGAAGAIAPVPEPSTWAMIAAAACGTLLAGVRSRRRA